MESASRPRAETEDIVLLISRLFLGAVFVYSGTVKAFGWSATVAEFQALGLPMTEAAVLLTVIVQLLSYNFV